MKRTMRLLLILVTFLQVILQNKFERGSCQQKGKPVKNLAKETPKTKVSSGYTSKGDENNEKKVGKYQMKKKRIILYIQFQRLILI